MKLAMLEQEYWYGACVKYGMCMPLHKESECKLDFTINQTPNQAMPLLLSTRGRYLWRDTGFAMTVKDGWMELSEDVVVSEGHGNLRGAYLAAMTRHFPFHAQRPADQLFEKIIYNTWIELTFYQNQKDILQYAKDILSHGLPPGVMMIDDGWAQSYGSWTFHSGAFPDSRSMISRLHDLGFAVMLWICPYVTADTVAYREAVSKDLLVKTPEGEPYLAKWWNGYSAVLDLSNPQAVKWLDTQLETLMEMGVDGFKFDAGDSIYYRKDNITAGSVTPDEHSRLWAAFGEKYAYNEYRATFGAGGYGLLQRLCDKEHSWGSSGIASLIPDTLLQGITGHPYSCPDMIGGGEYLSFQEVEKKGLDELLFIRHAEIACLMPAMQFSAAPYRVLQKECFQAVQRSIQVRNVYQEYLMACVRHAARTGEPVVRYMSYEFPDEPVERLTDQFMLGSELLVAPICCRDSDRRMVYVPKGTWEREGELLTSQGTLREFHAEPGVPVILKRIS